MPLQGDQLSRMTIRGFKSIKNCDISFGKINVLIGSNGERATLFRPFPFSRIFCLKIFRCLWDRVA